MGNDHAKEGYLYTMQAFLYHMGPFVPLWVPGIWHENPFSSIFRGVSELGQNVYGFRGEKKS
jgi:hypothetical protein